MTKAKKGKVQKPTRKPDARKTKIANEALRKAKIFHRLKREFLGFILFRLYFQKLIKSGLVTLCLCLTIISLMDIGPYSCDAAIAATHSHTHRLSSREREEDGAFSPRAHDRSRSPEGNGKSEHHSEFDHEAILGSTKDAEEFDNLPPEEAKKRLQVLIEKMDLDKDKTIERPELKAWIMRSFRMLSEEESKERLQEADANEDGRVTWLEYIEETFGLDAENLAIPLQDLEEQRMMADDKALFAGADKNADGYLDSKEYISFTHPEEDPTMLPIIYKQTLEAKDTDGDGQISFKEYIGDRAQDKDADWLKSEKAKFDEDLDKNGDGLLNRQEILSWVVPSNEEIAEEEVTHLFAASDDNHDDTLSYDEILDHHDIFVGSEATDYGDHLMNLDRFKEEL